MTRAIVRPWSGALFGAAMGGIAASIITLPPSPFKLALTALLAGVPILAWTLARPDRWLYAFFAAALLLPPLPIALGNSGPHVATIFAAAGLWMGMLRASDWRLRIDTLAAALLWFLSILAASVAIAAIYSGIAIAAGSLARVLLFGIGIYVFFFVRDGPIRFGDGSRLLRVLFFSAAGSALFACVDFYFQFPAPAGFGPQFLWLDSGVFRRAQGSFYEASTLGNLCAFFLLMIAVAFTRPRHARPVSTGALILGGLGFASALVLSYSRASLLNLVVAIVVLSWLQRGRIHAVRWLGGAGIATVAGLVAMVKAFPVFTAAYGVRLENSIQYFAESPNAVLSGRLANWKRLVDFLIRHPWHALTGVGFKTLPYSDYIGALTTTDNTYLSVLAETGILGVTALIALNAGVMRAAYRAARCAHPVRSFCGTCMFCFWSGQIVQMFSADLLTYWRVLPVYFCVLALADRE